MRRRQVGPLDDEPIIVEYYADFGDRRATDEQVGEISEGNGRGRSIALAAAVAVVALIAAIVFSRGGQQVRRVVPPSAAASASSATAAPSAPATTVEIPFVPATIPSIDSAVLEPSTSTSASTFPFGAATGLVLYLAPTGSPTQIVAYDIDHAETHVVNLKRDVGWFFGAIESGDRVVVDGGDVVSVSNIQALLVARHGENGFFDTPFGRVAAGPDGGVWIRTFDSEASGVALLRASGHSSGVFFPLPFGANLIGSMADGRPVVSGFDGRLFVVAPDGQRTLLATNTITPVINGRFAEIRCDDQQACSVVGHIDDREVDFGPASENGSRRVFRFQPNGHLVAVGAGPMLSLLNTDTGMSTVILTNLGAVGSGDDQGLADMRFLPGDLGMVVTTSDGIKLLDITGRVVATASVDWRNTVTGTPLLGVGHVRPWTP